MSDLFRPFSEWLLIKHSVGASLKTPSSNLPTTTTERGEIKNIIGIPRCVFRVICLQRFFINPPSPPPSSSGMREMGRGGEMKDSKLQARRTQGGNLHDMLYFISLAGL